MKNQTKYRWFVVGVFFLFMLLHQADRLLIGPLTTPIMQEFNINRAQMGAVTFGALIVGGIFFLIWGYLFDRYARARLLALASFIWGCTTWLSAIAPTFPIFRVTRASTGIDDASYPGVYSLISDYFKPGIRGRVYGILELTAPIGYLMGMILALFLGEAIGWRGVFYVTGSLGILVAVLIFFGVREPARGQSEPELAEVKVLSKVNFDWKTALDLFKKMSLIILFIQAFFGVFPWNSITYWFFNYLETERGYETNAVFVTMVVAVLVLAAGYPLGGWLGDLAFKRTPRGRALVATAGVLMGALMLIITLNIPHENRTLFMIMLAITALFIPMAAPNVVSTVYDITLPEVRSTALSVLYFAELLGAASSPWLTGVIADQSSLRTAFLIICVTTWLLCGAFFMLVAFVVPKDVATLRLQMRLRAEEELARQS